MAVTLGATYAMKLFCHCSGQLGLNVLHYRVNALTGPAPAEPSVAIAFENAFAGNLIACLNTEAAFLGVNIQQILPVLGLPVKSTLLTALGGGAGVVLPKQVAGLITKRTEFGGRHYRGRMYIPFPGESDNDATGVPSANYQTRLQAVAIQMISTLTVGAAVFAPIVFQRLDPLMSAQITSYSVRAKWANQHRRGDFGALNTQIVPG